MAHQHRLFSAMNGVNRTRRYTVILTALVSSRGWLWSTHNSRYKQQWMRTALVPQQFPLQAATDETHWHL